MYICFFPPMALQPFGPWPVFSFLILYIIGTTPRTGDQPSQDRYLHTEQSKQTSMPRVGFKPTIPVFGRTKTVYALGRPHTNCVKTSIKTWDKRDKSWRQHHDSNQCAAGFIISFVSTVLLSLRHVADIVSCLLHVLTHADVRPILDRATTVIGVHVPIEDINRKHKKVCFFLLYYILYVMCSFEFRGISIFSCVVRLAGYCCLGSSLRESYEIRNCTLWAESRVFQC
jgi:hypothetical protein